LPLSYAIYIDVVEVGRRRRRRRDHFR